MRRPLGWLIVLAVFLSGCFQYDLTLHFDHQTHGQVIQTIELGERGLALASGSLNLWLEQRRPQLQRLGGSLQQDAKTLKVVLPFSTGQDLVTRFNQLFAETVPTDDDTDFPYRLVTPGLGSIPFNLRADQQPWGLASRTHLVYDLDLRDFPATDTAAPAGRAIAQGATLSFRLQTPWGLRQVLPGSERPTASTPTETVWQLQTGRLNRVDVRFWLPNAVGLGAVGIAGLVLIGYFVRYRVLTPPGSSSSISFGQNKDQTG